MYQIKTADNHEIVYKMITIKAHEMFIYIEVLGSIR